MSGGQNSGFKPAIEHILTHKGCISHFYFITQREREIPLAFKTTQPQEYKLLNIPMTHPIYKTTQLQSEILNTFNTSFRKSYKSKC